MNSSIANIKQNEIAVSVANAKTSKLDALTSLRFFAAASIVVSHMVYFFPAIFDAKTMDRIPLAQGVSFFFVLSGFILTYVYPTFSDRASVMLFFRARLARIYPGYIFAMLICLCVFPLNSFTSQGAPLSGLIVTNLLLVHDWIPDPRWCLSLNPPSWSISAEFFFYLVFPLLVGGIKQNWPIKLAASSALAVLCLILCAYINPPELASKGFTIRGLVYYNPLCRLFEFVLGMSCYVLWQNLQGRLKFKPLLFTVLEAGAVALVLGHLLLAWGLVKPLETGGLPGAIRDWVIFNGNCFAYAGLIVVFALQKGALSRLLTNKIFTTLGEISYALYLLHLVALFAYQQNVKSFAAYHQPAVFTVFVALLLGASWVTYRYLEIPCRRWIGKKTAPKTLV